MACSNNSFLQNYRLDLLYLLPFMYGIFKNIITSRAGLGWSEAWGNFF